MKIHIIGCGDSAKHWKGESPSIGVNDCFKFGYNPTYLVILNSPNQFTPDRLQIIKNTKPHKVYTDNPISWGRVITDIPIHHFNSRQWSNSNRLQKLSKNYLYHSKTSPFAAISLAYSWGFTEIVLWGVDMVDHKTYKPGNGAYINEHASFKSFTMSLKEHGCNVYLGKEGSNLNFLPVYHH